MPELPSVIESRLRALPKGLREHIERSREIGRSLALRYNVDVTRVDIGVAAHDLARALNGDALLEQAERYGLQLHPVEEHSPILLHGLIAALWLEREDGFDDEDVLEAVRWHTTGRRGMGAIAKVVFLADKLDPNKVRRYPYLNEIQRLSEESLDKAMLEFLDQGLLYFVREGQLIHPESVELRNELMIALKDSKGRVPCRQIGPEQGSAIPLPQ